MIWTGLLLLVTSVFGQHCPPATLKQINESTFAGAYNPHHALKAFLTDNTIPGTAFPPLEVLPGQVPKRVPVKINFFLVSLQEVDEIRSKIVLNSLMEITWNASALGFFWADRAPHCNVQTFTVSNAGEKTYTPKIMVVNQLNTKDMMDVMQKAPLEIDKFGGARWRLYTTFRLSCAFRLTAWPYDYERCLANITFAADMGFTAMEQTTVTPVCSSMWIANPVWEFVGSRISASVKNGIGKSATIYTTTMEFIFKRDGQFHLIGLIVPTILLAYCGCCIFLLPPDNGEKMSVSFSVLLTFFLIFSTVVSTLPPSSTNMPLLYTYILTLFIIALLGSLFAAFLVHYSGDIKSAFVNQLISKIVKPFDEIRGMLFTGPNSSEGFVKTAVGSFKLKRIKRSVSEDSNGKPTNQAIESATVAKRLYTLNDIALVVYLFSVTLATIVFVVMLTSHNSAMQPVYLAGRKSIGVFRMNENLLYFSPVYNRTLCTSCNMNPTTGIIHQCRT